MNKLEIEQLIMEEFKSVPFHNLYFYLKLRPALSKYGGTCSDKVVNLYRKMNSLGIQVKLHTSFIDGEESHRLLRITVDEHDYFADIGNGWPSILMFPVAKNYSYEAFGFKYSSIKTGDRLDVYHGVRGENKLSVSIPFEVKAESLIWEDINDRFNKNNNYPFLHSVRFAQIVDDKFLFLRGDTLWVYSNNKLPKQVDLSGVNLSEILTTYFKFDLSTFIDESIKLES